MQLDHGQRFSARASRHGRLGLPAPGLACCVPRSWQHLTALRLARHGAGAVQGRTLCTACGSDAPSAGNRVRFFAYQQFQSIGASACHRGNFNLLKRLVKHSDKLPGPGLAGEDPLPLWMHTSYVLSVLSSLGRGRMLNQRPIAF